MNNHCVICTKADKGLTHTLNVFIENIQDYEYGIKEFRSLYECNSCGLVSMVPKIQSNELYKLYPDQYSSYLNKPSSRSLFSKIKNFINRYEASKVANLIPQNGVMIEVGCGNGLFLEEINKIRPDIKLIGYDIKETDYINQDLIEFYKGEFENLDPKHGACDLIYFSNLIEHVINPVHFLDHCHSLLKVQGIIYGVTPCHNSIDRKIFKKFWGGYHYPRHINIFNEQNIVKLLNLSSFKLLRVSGSYGFWYISLANYFSPLHGYKKRGLLFALCSLLFFPLDLIVNLFMITGSMTFIGKKS